MFRGILLGLGIVVVCIAIPIVHFITFPIGPFIAGYVGIEFVENRTDSASWRGLKYGAWIGAASLPVFALIGFILIALSDFGARNSTLIWILSFIIGPKANWMLVKTTLTFFKANSINQRYCQLRTSIPQFLPLLVFLQRMSTVPIIYRKIRVIV